MNPAFGVQEERAPASFTVVLGPSGKLEGRLASIWRRHDAITVRIAALAAGGQMLVHKRRLIRRDLVLRSGAELRERFGQLTPCVHIGLNSVREPAQGLDDGIF